MNDNVNTLPAHFFTPKEGGKPGEMRLKTLAERERDRKATDNYVSDIKQQAAIQASGAKQESNDQRLIRMYNAELKELKRKLVHCLPSERGGLKYRIEQTKFNLEKLGAAQDEQQEIDTLAADPKVAEVRDHANADTLVAMYPGAKRSDIDVLVELAHRTDLSPQELAGAAWRLEAKIASDSRKHTESTIAREQENRAAAVLLSEKAGLKNHEVRIRQHLIDQKLSGGELE